MKSYEQNITEGPIFKQLISFFFPLLLGALLQQLYTAADALIVGRYVGPEALASVGGSATIVIDGSLRFFVGLSSGAAILIAQYFGANKNSELSTCIHTGITFCLLIGLTLSIVGIAFFRIAYCMIAMPIRNSLDTIIWAYPISWIITAIALTIYTYIFNDYRNVLKKAKSEKEPCTDE